MYQGQCAPAPLQKGRSYLNNATDCAGPHDFEVLYAPDSLLGTDKSVPYPGVDALKSVAEASCSAVFGLEGVFSKEERDELTHISLVPSRESWTARSEDMDRSLYCLVARRDGNQLTEKVVPEN